jgi:hypothetical protein
MTFSDEFLDDPFDNEGGGMSDDIALVYTSFVYQAGKYEYGDDTRQYFAFTSQDNMAAAKEKCAEYIKENKLDGFPKLGILTEIPIDTFLTAHGKMTWDVSQFVNSFFAAKFQLGDNGKLDIDQQDKVKGLLPYDLATQSIRQFRECLSGPVWAKIKQETNWYTEALGLRKNENYPNKIYVIKEVFKSKEEAYTAANMSLDDGFGDFGGEGLSEYAKANDWTLEKLREQSLVIHGMISDALKGKDMPDNKPMENDAAIKMVCDAILIKPEDLNLLEIEVAF